KQAFSRGFDVSVVARTQRNNIRLFGPGGSSVIFNWEVNPRELRVTRPDGVRDQSESGSLATAQVQPLLPDQWYDLRWTVTETGMTVSVNEVVVFAEQQPERFTDSGPISIRAIDSVVDVKSMTVATSNPGAPPGGVRFVVGPGNSPAANPAQQAG